jgi:two-component system chemotaxis sensor kinase CheA
LQLDEWVQSLDEDHNERCDDELMNEIFRSAHSLKGLSAMLGLGDINNLTHKVENVFDAARKDELIITGDVVELMFQAVDRLVGQVDVLKEPDSEAVECESVLENIRDLLQSAGVERKQASQKDAERALEDIQAELAQPDPEVATPGLESGPSTEIPCSSDPTDVFEGDVFEGLEDETEVLDKYLSIFIDETELALDSLTETFLALEGGGSREELESLLVISHRIKGSAASVGLNRAAKLAHLMEDLLQNLLDSSGTLSAEVTDAMLLCIDGLRQYVDDLKKGAARSDHFGQLAHELQQAWAVGSSPAVPSLDPLPSPGVATSGPGSESTSPRPIKITDQLRNEVAAATPIGAQALVGWVAFRPNLPLVGLKARLIYEKLGNLGEVCYFDPPAEQLDDLDELDHVTFGVVTEKSVEEVHRPLRIAGVRDSAIEPLTDDESSAPSAVQAQATKAEKASPQGATPAPKKQSASSGPAAPAQARPAEGGNRPTETLRVDIDRLDQLMNLAGELVINRARLSRIGDTLKSAVAGKQSAQVLDGVLNSLGKMAGGKDLPEKDMPEERQHLQAELEHARALARRIQNDLEPIRRDVDKLVRAHGAINDLDEAIHQLDRVSDGIQKSVMDTRMVPIGPLFTRFKRVIRDITRSNGKIINLVIRGEKTELDKRMIDELSDPLIHMVRNSADHGIEPPEVREAAGKPREGTVTLDAFHRGNSIFIQVTDDGKGLDHQTLLKKALDKGMVSEADAEKMTPHQIYQLIWEPGLSTAEKVTEVSGRGMGMDIVRSKIEGLNGTVDLDSTPGKGTTLTIKLPLTLAILPSLMVEIEGDAFAMPMESVAEIVSVKTEDLTTLHGMWTARVRGRAVSVVKLGDVFSWHNRHERKNTPDDGETTLVIIGEKGRQIALTVDRVLGEEDVVIKSMAENYQNIPGIAGASILGDGRVSLILDIIALIDMTSRQASATVPS